MGNLLSNTRFLANFIWRVDQDAVFSYGDEDDPDFLTIRADVWEDMGKPATITVSITPGDAING